MRSTKDDLEYPGDRLATERDIPAQTQGTVVDWAVQRVINDHNE